MTSFRSGFTELRIRRVVLLCVGVLAGLTMQSGTVAAACSGTPPAEGGTATFSMTVPTTTTYRFWTRVYAPSEANNGAYLFVDGTHCRIVGDSKLTANQFTWVNYQEGDANNKLDLNLTAGEHKIVFAGLDEGVGIDKVLLLADTACVPVGDGNNCAQDSSSAAASTLIGDGSGGAQTSSTKEEGWLPSSAKQPVVMVGSGLVLAAIALTVLWFFKPELLRRGIERITRVFKRNPYNVQPSGVYSYEGQQAVIVSSHSYMSKRPTKGLIFAGAFAVIGGAMIVLSLAAGQSASYVLANAALTGKATLVDKTDAIGGKMVQFGAAAGGAPASNAASSDNKSRTGSSSGGSSTSPKPGSGGTTPSNPGSGSSGCSSGQVGTAPNCFSAPPFSASSGKKWQVSFTEEFGGSGYSSSKLTPCFDWNYGACTATFNNGRERYMPEQVQVSGGTAKLVAAPLSPPYSNGACQNGQCTYKAGLLSTARPRADNGSDYLYKFTYGYVESRFKFPATQGFFTAFWMLPADPSYNYRTEIDILELLGDDPSTMFMTYHYNDRSSSYNVNSGKFNNGACPVKNYANDFVRMGLDWQPNRIAWYIDGVKCAEFTNASKIESGPMQIILHMMVDNNWQRSWNVGLLDPNLTRQLEVDYIRVYQQVNN